MMGEYGLLKHGEDGESIPAPESQGQEMPAAGNPAAHPESGRGLAESESPAENAGNGGRASLAPCLHGDTDGLAQRDRQLEERRRQAAEKLRNAIAGELAGISPEDTKTETFLWNALILYQDVPFVTSKNLQFTYSIRGYEMFVSRKDKSITRSTVNLAFGMAMKLLREDQPISGPKKLGTFGASYLYPIFIHIGVIPAEKTKKRKRQKTKEQD